MEKLTLEPIDVSAVKEAEQETQVIVKEAQALVIKTPKDYEIAGSMRAKIKGRIKNLDEKRKAITQPLDLAKKNIMALFNPVIERLNNCIEIIDAGTLIYNEEQDRIAQEAQAKADEEARKAREKAEARAKELEAQGKTEKAQVMQEKANGIIAPVITPAVPKVAGQAIKTYWYAEVVDFKVLPDEYKLPNQSALDKVAQATQGKLNISGVVFKSRKGVSGRSA